MQNQHEYQITRSDGRNDLEPPNGNTCYIFLFYEMTPTAHLGTVGAFITIWV